MCYFSQLHIEPSHMRNIIDAICTIVENPQYALQSYSNANNRANNMGAGLEEYIKDIFAGTVGVSDTQLRNQMISSEFSYLGNQNNPPDSMLKNGAAIEVKKIQSRNSLLALNSSYPKAKLLSDSPLISKDCKECEKWTEKDMLYCVGVVDKNNLSSLAIVYGEDYCASKEVYEKVRNTIKSGVASIENVEFAETKELGRVNRVDPLGITYLRIRGMWGIENPFVVFSYIFKCDLKQNFNFMCIINDDKFNQLPNLNSLLKLQDTHPSLKIDDVQIKNPNNPAQLKSAKLITFKI